jgi:hypothetical protein
MSREDLFGFIEDESVPDVVIKYEDNENLPAGSGSVDFGAVQVETDKTAQFTVTNTGGMALHITDVYLSSGQTDQFSLDLSATSSVLPPGSSTSFSLSFEPTLVGLHSAVVVVETDDPDTGAYSFEVTGYGSAIPVPDIVLLRGGTVVPEGSEGCDYGTLLVGDLSGPETFVVENNGTADLEIYGVSCSGGAASDYLIDDSMLDSTVVPGGISSFTVVFSPTAAGGRAATVSVQNSDADEDPYTFTLTGTGEPRVPEIYVAVGMTEIPENTTAYDFGSVTIGGSSSPLTVTIGNRGTEVLNIPDISSSDPSQFSIDESGRLFSLQPGDVQTTSFMITFLPAGPAGSVTADITITNDDPLRGSYTFQVVGTASPIPVPEIGLRRNSSPILNGGFGCDFGPVEIGQTSTPVTFTIENGGAADLTVSTIGTGSSLFSIAGAPTLPVDIGPGGSETFAVTFSPVDIGQVSTDVSVYSDDPDDNPFIFTVQGEAALPDMRVMRGSTAIPNGDPNAQDFGNVLVGDSSTPTTFTIENNGDADLHLQSISFISGDVSDFSYDDGSTSSTVSPGGSTSVSVTFTPTGTGSKSVTLSIENDDPFKDPYSFTVWGLGEPKIPDIHLRQGSTNLPSGSSTYDYGTVLLGTGSPVQFTIRNRGTGDLQVSSISSSSGEFIITSAPSLPLTLAPSTNAYFTVEFAPSVAGSRSATIDIFSDDPDGFENPYILGLQGYGETPVPVMDLLHGTTHIPNTTGIYFFGHVQEGDSRMETFTIENNGTSTLIISGIVPSSGDTDQFVVDFSIPPIAPGSSNTFMVTFSPTFPGDKWAIITVLNNDPNNDPYTFRVEGMVGLPPVVDVEVWEGATYYPDGSTYSGFGTVSVGSSSVPVTFFIWNNGPDDLVIPNIVITGGSILEFDLDLNSTDLNTPIPPGVSTTFTVTFSPLSSGSKWLDLDINYNDPIQTPYQIRLEGQGED